MVRLEMEVAGLKNSETDMINPDFALVAEATGIKGMTISDPNKLESSLKEAFAFNGPILVNIMTDPDALAMPPKIELSMVNGMELSMAKMMLGGDYKEVFGTIESNYKHLDEIND